MITNIKTFLSGSLIIIIPFLGIPLFWKTTFIVLIGIYLMVSSIKFDLPKKTTVKRGRKKEKITSVFTENSPEQFSSQEKDL